MTEERATTEADVQRITSRWNNGIGPDELHDALGWTKDEYKTWSKTGQLPQDLSSITPPDEIGPAQDNTQVSINTLSELREDLHSPITPQAPDLMDALKASLDAVRGPLETSDEDIEGDMVGDKTEPEISDAVASNPFLAGLDVELTPQQKALIEGQEPDFTAMARATRTSSKEAAQATVEVLQNVSERFHEAVTRKPSLMSADEAETLDVESFVLPDVDKGPLPNIADIKYVDIGDQITLEWDTREDTPARYTGLVIGLDRESGSRGMTSPWIYLRGEESHLRTPMEGIRIVAHLLNHKGQWLQTNSPEEFRPGR